MMHLSSVRSGRKTSRRPPSAVAAAFFLQEGEKFKDYWDAQAEYVSGVLVLTNFRLLFIAKEGSFSPQYSFGFDVSLEAVQGLSIRKRLISPPQLLFGKSSFVLGKPSFAVERLTAVRAKIEKARTARSRMLSQAR